MGSYLPSTKAQQDEMLAAIGLSSMDELYTSVPSDLILADGPELPPGLSELEVRRRMTAIAAKNTVFPTIFRGAGAYRHYIPAQVSYVVSKETFLTAYTPYQAEISQGILQSIFEYQTMICELTGLDASNASLYDAASAAAEAAAMCKDRKRSKILISAAAHPDSIETIKTYCWASDSQVELIPSKGGCTDMEKLKDMLDDQTAGIFIQQPNFYGQLEDCSLAADLAHEAGAKMIMAINPIASALIKSPGECGADIAVGEGQPLGIPLSFGGPYLGFIATTTAMVRRLPGRIAGETVDVDGKRAYVLTLQAREQHIRREKSSSNVCSNQALCAMTASVYLATMGPNGLREAASQCLSKAHYLADILNKLGLNRRYEGDFFNEFLTDCPVDIDGLLSMLEGHGILGGLKVDGGILWCATEMNTKAEMDKLAELVQSYIKSDMEREGK